MFISDAAIVFYLRSRPASDQLCMAREGYRTAKIFGAILREAEAGGIQRPPCVVLS